MSGALNDNSLIRSGVTPDASSALFSGVTTSTPHFSSIKNHFSGGTDASTSSSVGIPAPDQAALFQAPASRRRSSFMVEAAISSSSPVVRPVVASCMQAITPSAVRRKSASMPSAPSDQASLNDSSVFSGASRDAPRCPIISGSF